MFLRNVVEFQLTAQRYILEDMTLLTNVSAEIGTRTNSILDLFEERSSRI
jgi:hypothetical protein